MPPTHPGAAFALQVKSHCSLGLGVASPGRLAERAAELGLGGLALTDLENLRGQVEHHHAGAAHGLKALTGVELRPGFRGAAVPGAARGRVVLLARDRTGYRSLCRIVTARRCPASAADVRTAAFAAAPPRALRPAPALEATGRPDPLRLLRRHPDGLFVLSDDVEVVERLLDERAVDPAALRLLLPRPVRCRPADRRLRRASERLRVPLVAALDAVLAQEAEWPLHLLSVAIQRRRSARDVRDASAAERPGRRLRSAEELGRLFADVPGALEEARAIAEACDLDLRDRDLSAAPRDAEASAHAARRLRSVARDGLARLRGDGRCRSAGYAQRLERELRAIARLGFSEYLLAVYEIGRVARELDVDVTARGSAVGSLVLHVLGLSPVDPVSHGLCFERFINPRRGRPPDVDLDVCSSRRDGLLDAVHRRLGEDRVALVSALQTFGARSAVAEGLAALEAPPGLAERLLASLPPDVEPEDLRPWLEARLPPSLRRAAPVLAALLGLPRHPSTHTGGIVVAEGPLRDLVPLERAPGGWRVTQYDARSIGATGLPKIDLLGSRCLSELREAVDRASRRTGRRARALRDGGLRSVPLDDPATLAALDSGDTVGCFQLETPAVRAALASVPVRGLSDAAAALALVRPGPAAGEAKRRFLARARGWEPAVPPHPALEDALRESRGLLLYEEDVLRTLARLGGLEPGRADELREAVAASDGRPGALRRLEGHFLSLASANGFPPEEAGPVWREVERFAAYSFSKAHASSYARLGYLAAYMKTHFPTEFGCALLNHHGGLYPPRAIGAEIARWGVQVRPPCVNRSAWGCQTEPSGGPDGGAALRLGLDRLRGFPAVRARRLLETRSGDGPFRCVEDLRCRVAPRPTELRALVLSGACDALGPLAGGRYPWVHRALLAGVEQATENGRAPPSGDDGEKRYAALVRVRNELRYLRMHPSAHPMQVLRGEAEVARCVTCIRAREEGGRRIRLAGLASASRRVRTRAGETMQFVTLEDETGTLEGVVFPDAWRRYGRWLRSGGPFLVEGEVRGTGAAAHVAVKRLLPFVGRRWRGRVGQPPLGRRARPVTPRPGAASRPRSDGPARTGAPPGSRPPRSRPAARGGRR